MDEMGLNDQPQKEIVEKITSKEFSPWWANMISGEYRRYKSFRKKRRRPRGFEVSIRKTCQSPVDRIFDQTVEWFHKDDRTQLTNVREGKHFRCDWLTDDSRLAVHFYEKEENKTQIVIQHEALPNELDAAIMRNYWKERLQQMVEAL